MTLKCVFGIHKWHECKCECCGKTRKAIEIMGADRRAVAYCTYEISSDAGSLFVAAVT